MHVYAGEKPVEDKEKKKRNDLINVAKDIFRFRNSITNNELADLLMKMLEVKERTSKSYIQYMKAHDIIGQDGYNNYVIGKQCN